MVYQEFTLVPVLSAAENIFLGEFIRKGWICNRKAMNEKAAELFKMLKIKLEPEVKVEDLTTGYPVSYTHLDVYKRQGERRKWEHLR